MFGAAPPIDASWVPPLVQKSEDQAGFVMEVCIDALASRGRGVLGPAHCARFARAMQALAAHPILRHHSLDQRCLFVDAAEEAFFEAGDVLCEAGAWSSLLSRPLAVTNLARHAQTGQLAGRCLIVESGSVQQGDQTWHRGAVFGVEVRPADRAPPRAPPRAPCATLNSAPRPRPRCFAPAQGLLYPCAYRHTVVACSETTCWTLEPSTYRRILRETRVDEPEVVPAAAADAN